MLITDSFGRAWRNGQCDVAIGCAGLGRWRTGAAAPTPAAGAAATWIAVADELAAAADLARAKDAMPARGADPRRRAGTSSSEDGPGRSLALLRPPSEDLFR